MEIAGKIFSVLVLVVWVLYTVYLFGSYRYTKQYGWEHKSTIHFGNLTGSGLPVEEVRANAHLYPLSGLPESEQARKAFVESL